MAWVARERPLDTGGTAGACSKASMRRRVSVRATGGPAGQCSSLRCWPCVAQQRRVEEERTRRDGAPAEDQGTMALDLVQVRLQCVCVLLCAVRWLLVVRAVNSRAETA